MTYGRSVKLGLIKKTPKLTEKITKYLRSKRKNNWFWRKDRRVGLLGRFPLMRVYECDLGHGSPELLDVRLVYICSDHAV